MGIGSKIKAVYLDRDGVINKAIVIDGKPYPPSSLKELELIEGVKEGLKALKDSGYKLFVVTNQPDVARGKTALESVLQINNYIVTELGIDEVYCCFHDDEENCKCRKPKPGMILKASEKWNIDLDLSFMIGDRWRDIEAGKAAGVKTILINYGYDEKKVSADFECSNFETAINYILKIH